MKALATTYHHPLRAVPKVKLPRAGFRGWIRIKKTMVWRIPRAQPAHPQGAKGEVGPDGPPPGYDYREGLVAETRELITRRYPQLLDLVDDGG